MSRFVHFKHLCIFLMTVSCCKTPPADSSCIIKVFFLFSFLFSRKSCWLVCFHSKSVVKMSVRITASSIINKRWNVLVHCVFIPHSHCKQHLPVSHIRSKIFRDVFGRCEVGSRLALDLNPCSNHCFLFLANRPCSRWNQPIYNAVVCTANLNICFVVWIKIVGYRNQIDSAYWQT